MTEFFNLIEYTHRSVFLTGKAGTGKTTFLANFVKNTKKKYLVAAPTGIAAINAGGVTLHSLFGLPLKTHIPTYDNVDPNVANNISHLVPHFKYRKDKLKLLRHLEILIVDEVSMLRCDVLDMVDLALRIARRNTKKFGGVQLLLIGDLYQLPPVVKEESESLLYKYYSSPFFFDANALKGVALLTLELKKVYRQTDAVFLELLNGIRNKNLSTINFELLNSRYNPQFEPKESYVYLTSHNYIADAINNKNLEELEGKPHQYPAEIEGDFKSHLFPNEEVLALKVGAQVMFIRNDTAEEKRFFNGKLAKVEKLSQDLVTVLPEGETERLEIERETWENKRYYLDEEMQIQADLVGSYRQFPFRLAWAVTIHKSQGLTFDRVIIDAGRSFAAGQVYVALSRCRTLEGIVLKSKIHQNVILYDDRIAFFQQQTDASENINAILEEEKYQFAIEKVLVSLDLGWLLPAIKDWKDAIDKNRVLKKEELNSVVASLISETNNLNQVFKKFEGFVWSKMKPIPISQDAWFLIEQKCMGAVRFFFENVEEIFLVPAMKGYAESKGAKGLKAYNKILKALLGDIENYLNQLQQLHLLEKPLFKKEQKEKVRVQIDKKPSHLITFDLFEEGMSVLDIATNRGMATSTILAHLSKMAAVGVLDLHRVFAAEKIESFLKVYEKQNFESLTQWKSALPQFFEFDEIRVLLAHFNYQKKKRETLD